MYIRIKMPAHEAILKYLSGDGRVMLTKRLSERLYDVVKKAENDQRFACELDAVFISMFDDGTAEGFDDLIRDFDTPPKALADLLDKWNI